MSQGTSFLYSILPLIVIFLIFYLLIFLPHSREEKKRKKMLENLKKGDKVITTGGIYGVITKVDKNTVNIKVAENVIIKFDKNAISYVIKSQN